MTSSPSGPAGTAAEAAPPACRIATAGWAIPRAVADRFPSEGTGLARYAARFSAVEINSTFYRPHRASTFARWAATTPAGFRFALKAPRAITHEARLRDADALVAAFVDNTAPLGDRRGPLLVQLPPSLAFEPEVAAPFFAMLGALWPTAVACEPRHPSWFAAEAEPLLRDHRVARVAADPPRHPVGGAPGGWPGLVYWRLHGAPRVYYTAYADAVLDGLATRLAQAKTPETQVWCVFDNTTAGAAAADALRLQAALGV